MYSRITHADWFHDLAAFAAECGHSLFLLGGGWVRLCRLADSGMQEACLPKSDSPTRVDVFVVSWAVFRTYAWPIRWLSLKGAGQRCVGSERKSAG